MIIAKFSKLSKSSKLVYSALLVLIFSISIFLQPTSSDYSAPLDTSEANDPLTVKSAEPIEDIYEENDNIATATEVNFTLSQALFPNLTQFDSDVFKVYLDDFHQVNVSYSGGLAYGLQWFDDQGGMLNNYSVTYNATTEKYSGKFSFFTLENNSFYLNISGQNLGMEYALNFTLQNMDDEWEDNDDVESATFLNVTDQAVVFYDLALWDDDIFQFNLSDKFQVEILYTGEWLNRFDLVTEQGVLLSSGSLQWNATTMLYDGSLFYTSLNTSTVYLNISGFNMGDLYFLNCSSAYADDIYEENDILDTATVVDVGLGSGSFVNLTQYDIDLYRFDLGDKEQLEIFYYGGMMDLIDFLNGSGDHIDYIHTMWNSETDLEEGTLIYTTLSSGTYYLNVSSSNWGVEYALNWSVAYVDDVYEDNDDLENATVVDIASGSGSFVNLTQWDDDLYRFDLGDKDQLEIFYYGGVMDLIDFLNGSGDHIDYIHTMWNFETGLEEGTLIYTTLSPGTYYLNVSSSNW
ncbi:MAG: hypothetical protein ACTSYI_16795, partial [Promethearchaeota archaeon]